MSLQRIAQFERLCAVAEQRGLRVGLTASATLQRPRSGREHRDLEAIVLRDASGDARHFRRITHPGAQGIAGAASWLLRELAAA